MIAMIKLRYPFWNRQPVYHSYDLWNKLYSQPYSPYQNGPVKTKYYDNLNVLTLSYSDMTNKQKKDLTNLLQCYYIPSDSILNTIQRKDLGVYFGGVNEPAYISFYTQDELANKDGNFSTTKLPVACITSRFAQLLVRPTMTEEKYTCLPIYFIDHVCVDRDHENQRVDISRKLLQTHEYNQRINNVSIYISLIKSETNLFDGVVPLFTYTMSTFALRPQTVQALPPHFQIVRIYKENMDVLTDFLHMQKNLTTGSTFPFDLFLVSDLDTIIAAIQAQLLYACCIQRSNIVYGIYFIKNARLRYEEADGNTLHCIGSVMNYVISKEDYGKLFYLGFLHSLGLILREKPSFNTILFDELGHNELLLQFWRERHTELEKCQTAYYSYNWIVPKSPFLTDRCAVILI
uniref:Glycylpeptide N-tetradecanoyltransferase n=1 Tax=viral metagenome TaxID=1070528 RepID=A0A6C0I5J6_9ZZZZ